MSQNSQGNTCGRANYEKKQTLAQVFSCGFCEIFNSTSVYRLSLVAASDSTGYY